MDLPSNNLNHPSNELHDAAYPMSDYQPTNMNPLQQHHHQQPLPQQPAQSLQGGAAAAAAAPSAKYTEIATPALALTSGQASSSWHTPGPSHLDTSLDPPPSYEQSQSHSQSRPSTSNQPSSSSLSIVPPPSSVASPNSPSAPSISSGQAPLPPSAAYHPGRPPAVGRPSNYPPVPSTATSATAAGTPPPNGPIYGVMPGMGYQKQDMAVHQTSLNRLRRKSCYITLLLIGIFVLAVFVGLMVGFRDKFEDNGHQDQKRPQQLNAPSNSGGGHGGSSSNSDDSETIFSIFRGGDDDDSS